MEELEIMHDEKGKKVVLIPQIIFLNKQDINRNERNTGKYNIYRGCLVVNCTSAGKKYLYDFVDIKKEASNPFKTIKSPNGSKLLLSN